MASGQFNGAVSLLPCQSVDGFMILSELYNTRMNGLIDAIVNNGHEFTRIFIIGWGKDLYHIFVCSDML